jgi:GT2 family glycosyltransferase
MICIDIIILSYAKNQALRKVTENAIQSLLDSEDTNAIKFNVIVIESEKNAPIYEFQNTQTIYPNESFNFHRFLNIGVRNSTSEYLCFCNNDLYFEKHWASRILEAFNNDVDMVSASPICPIFHPTINIHPFTGVHEGYEIRKELAGWCFLIKREILKTIGMFDENFKFWYADADYSKTLQKYNLKHALITDSLVKHLDRSTTKELSYRERISMTTDQFWYFQYKWEHKNYLLYCYRLFRVKSRLYLNLINGK